MIIANGTIEIKNKTTQGIDTRTGYPAQPQVATWGEPIECQYTASLFNQLATSNDESFVSSSYTIFIEEMNINAEQIRLKDKAGKTLGEFSIKHIEPLEAVCELLITV